jgi:hypothetical protein
VRVDVTGAGVHLRADERRKVVRTVLLALCRFGPRVARVGVRLTEIETPFGTVGRSCRMQAWLGKDRSVEVEVNNGAVDAAVGRAATRLAGRVERILDGASGAALGLQGGARSPMRGCPTMSRRVRSNRRRAVAARRRE